MLNKKNKVNIAIFASGSGSNAENIARYFESRDKDKVTLILTDNPEAGVIERARKLQIPILVFKKEQLNQGFVLSVLHQQEIDFIVLAGFLKLIPSNLIHSFPKRIINIHPALLPKYGGKGMYGQKVHQAVKDAQETETGITIHYVNEEYDDGDIIFQVKEAIRPKDSVQEIEKKVHKLEYMYYPEVIEDLLDELRED